MGYVCYRIVSLQFGFGWGLIWCIFGAGVGLGKKVEKAGVDLGE